MRHRYNTTQDSFDSNREISYSLTNILICSNYSNYLVLQVFKLAQKVTMNSGFDFNELKRQLDALNETVSEFIL